MIVEPFELSPALALDVAAGIGFGIARRALWHADRCVWFDPTPTPLDGTPPTSATSTSDVYGGTAGVGLFLAQLVARADDVTLRRTARGAIRQALSTVSTAPPLGFYGGAAGTAAVAILAARELDEEEFVEPARALLQSLPLAPDDPDQNDLIGGTAGSLLALVVASSVLGDGVLLARAQEAAEIVLGLALRGEGGIVSWSTMPDRLGDLTGFANGSAGNAYALLALHALAPDSALRDAAAGAIAYETSTFSAEHGNWPDLRSFGSGPREPGFSNAWCHGAVGIVRARLFAEQHGFAVARDIDTALATIAAQAELLLATPSGDMTLCHGLTGAVDALLDAVRSGRGTYVDAIATAAAQGAERHHRGDDPWPSGLLTREPHDGLMLGNAGIGHVYLRLADPSLAPVLAPASA